jgi:beta-aspartyl-peptidase (threonine type)
VAAALAAFGTISGVHADDATAAGLRKVLMDQVDAWNRGDLEGFMMGYWHSPELTFFSGKDKRHGWQETIDRYRARYQQGGRDMGRLAFRELQIQSLDASSAWVRGRWELEKGSEKAGGLFTLIFKKMPEGWRIVHDHTSG